MVAMSIVEVAAHPVGDDGVARLVDGDGVALPLDVLDVLAGPELLQLLGLDDVGPRDRVAAVADGA